MSNGAHSDGPLVHGPRVAILGRSWAKHCVPKICGACLGFLLFGIAAAVPPPAAAQTPAEVAKREVATSNDVTDGPGMALGSQHDRLAVTWTKNGRPLCNADSFAQIPTDPNLFLGRVMLVSPQESCSGKNWSLALFRMDWASHELQFVRDVLVPTVSLASLPDSVVTTAYDPTVTLFDGTLWVAFECGGGPPKDGWTWGTSSCVGPLDLQNGIDTTRTTVVVHAGANPKGRVGYSSSVPKIFTFNNKMYLYWSSIQGENQHWLQSTTRGMELVVDRGKVWGVGSPGVPVAAHDPQLNVEVMGVNPTDYRSNTVASIFGVFVDGGRLIATAGLGGSGAEAGPEDDSSCHRPRAPRPGCFRLVIAESNTPLGVDIFNHSFLTLPRPPINPQVYTRIDRKPDGSLFLMGDSYDPRPNLPGQNTIPSGFWMYPFDLRSAVFSPRPSAP